MAISPFGCVEGAGEFGERKLVTVKVSRLRIFFALVDFFCCFSSIMSFSFFSHNAELSKTGVEKNGRGVRR